MDAIQPACAAAAARGDLEHESLIRQELQLGGEFALAVIIALPFAFALHLLGAARERLHAVELEQDFFADKFGAVHECLPPLACTSRRAMLLSCSFKRRKISPFPLSICSKSVLLRREPSTFSSSFISVSLLMIFSESRSNLPRNESMSWLMPSMSSLC